jgi:sulfur carrier protein ThiS
MADVVINNIIIVPDEDWEDDNEDNENIIVPDEDWEDDNEDNQNTIEELWEEMHNLKVQLFDIDTKLSKLFDNELKG